MIRRQERIGDNCLLTRSADKLTVSHLPLVRELVAAKCRQLNLRHKLINYQGFYFDQGSLYSCHCLRLTLFDITGCQEEVEGLRLWFNDLQPTNLVAASQAQHFLNVGRYGSWSSYQDISINWA